MDPFSHPPLCDGVTLERRPAREAFEARGLHSSEDARRTGSYLLAELIHAELQRRLDARTTEVLE